MAIYQPSQYDCDNMEDGDLILYRKRNFLYAWYRKHFQKDKTILRIKPDSFTAGYRCYYQEDCTLVYKYELASVQSLKSQVPCIINFNPNGSVGYKTILKDVRISLSNIQFIFNNNLTLTMPVKSIEEAVNKNREILENSRDSQKIHESLKYKKHKGDYFRNRVKDRHIEQWIPAFCSICGNPIIFKFNDENVDVINKCECGNITLDYKELNYDELATWYYSQVTDSLLAERYKEFWFGD